MLYVNGKLVDFTNKAGDYQFKDIVADFHKNISELEERHGDSIVFITPSRQPRIDKITKEYRPHKPYSWPYKTVIYGKEGTQEWVYTSSAPTIKDGNVTPAEANFIISRGEKKLSLKQDSDLIFFLQHISAFRKGKLSIYDPEHEQDARAEKIKQESKLKDMLYSEYSPLSKDRDKLNVMASKWGVANAAAMTSNALRNTLHDIVFSGEQDKRKRKDGARGIKEFVADMENTETTKVGADVQYAMDKGVLFYDKTAGQWKITAVNTDVPIVLMDVGNTSVKLARERLIEFLMDSKEDSDVLDKAIHGGVKIEYGKVVEKPAGEAIVYPDGITLENLYEKDENDKYVVGYAYLQKALKQMGVSNFGGKDEAVRNLVKETLEKLHEQDI